MPIFGLPNVARLNSRGCTKGLIKALAYQKDDGVLAEAAKVFGEIGDARAVEPLIAAFKDSDQYGCWTAADRFSKHSMI